MVAAWAQPLSGGVPHFLHALAETEGNPVERVVQAKDLRPGTTKQEERQSMRVQNGTGTEPQNIWQVC
jgi:hypothetical protein